MEIEMHLSKSSMDVDKNASSSEETISLSGSSDNNEEQDGKVESVPG